MMRSSAPLHIDRLSTAEAQLPTLEMELERVQQELERVKCELASARLKDENLNGFIARLDEELRLAGRVQRDFLPKDLPKVGGIRFHTLFRPAGHVSGDLYDVMRLDESHVGFYIADAVGHGVPAALLTMFIKNALVTKHIDSTGYRLLKPSETIARLNETIVQQQLSPSTFATAIYGMINMRTLRLTFARGGHPHPILFRENGAPSDLVSEGGLLGVFADETFETTEVQLCPGDRLVVYSDGLELMFSDLNSTDARSWQTDLAKLQAGSSEQFIAALANHIDARTSKNTPPDDITVLAIDVNAA